MTDCIEDWNDRNEIPESFVFSSFMAQFPTIYSTALLIQAGEHSRIRHFLIKQLWNCQIALKNNQVVPIKWNSWSFTQVRWSNLVPYLVLYRGEGFTKSVKICKIHEAFSSTEFLYFRHMFIVPEPKWTQRLAFIAFFACKQNLRASLILRKELEVFPFMFKCSFICHIMICVNVNLLIFKDNWHGF